MSKKIGDGTIVSAVGGTDKVEVSQGDTTQWYATMAQIATYLASPLAAVFAAIGTTISAAGLATGGGSLAANRTITVPAATDAETRALTSSTAALTPANLAARAIFGAHKNGTNQTGIATATATLLTWGTELRDVGNYFASNAWTPPAGPVRMSVAVYATGCTAGSAFSLMLYKNGAEYQRVVVTADASGVGSLGASWNDVANGTDAYTIYVLGTTGATITVNGGANLSFFQGEQI